MAPGPIELSVVEAVLADFQDPETGRSVTQLGQVSNVQIDGDSVALTLALTTHSAPLWNETKASLDQLLRERVPGVGQTRIDLAVHERPPQPLGQLGLRAKSVIAVGSGKGGVGKSTVSTCLAYGLRRAGCRVGLMDADVYGPSIPKLTGISGTPADVQTDTGLKPISWDGIPVMSIGFLIDDAQAVVWRGPMLHKLVNDFLGRVEWGDLDYLIIDMPPGTGDVALSLSQALPDNTGAVVVCTPQEVALLDAVRSINMMRQVNVPILGIVENMSGFICPGCDKRYDIFGRGGAEKCAEQLGIPFLGEVPININIRQRGDAGESAANFDDAVVAPYMDEICNRLVRNRAQANADEPPLPTLNVL